MFSVGLRWLWSVLLLAWPLSARTVFHYHYGARNGLTQNSVRLLQQDPQGMVWVGTEAGLSRFDGRFFWNFSHGNGFENHPVDATAWHDGHLLSLTESGVLFELGLNQARRAAFAERAYGMFEGPAGAVYLLTADALVAIGSGARFPLVVAGQPVQAFRTKAHSLGGTLFFSLDQDLFQFDGTSVQLLHRFARPVLALVTTPNQQLGVLQAERLLERRPSDGDATFVNYFQAPDDAVLTCADGNGRRLLIGTRAGDLLTIDDQGTRRLSSGLPRKALLTVMIDREDNLWGGYDSGGLVLVPKVKFVSYTARDGVGSGEAFYLVHDRFRGGVLVGTRNGGMAHIGPDRKVTAYRREHGLPTDQVRALFQARDGRVFVGTQNGVARLDLDGAIELVVPGCGATYRIFFELDNGDIVGAGIGADLLVVPAADAARCERATGLPERQDVRCLFVYEDFFYLGSSAGLFRAKVGSYRFEAVPEFAGVGIIDAQHEREGVLWVAARDQGLWRVEGGVWQKSEVELEQRLRGLFQDPLGRIWAAGAHAVYLHDGEWRKISGEQGLNSDDIYLVGFDSLGQTWVGTNRGLNLLEHDVVVDAFDFRDGLADDELNASGFVIDEQNNAWFCTMGGVSVIQPRAIPRNQTVPLTQIAAYSHEPWYAFAPATWRPFDGAAPRFEPHQNAPLFYLTSSCYANPEAVRFRTQLLRDDHVVQDWGQPQARCWVALPNLAPGRYTLAAKSCNNDGVWSDPVQRSFSIAPTLWQSAWVRWTVWLLPVLVPAGFFVAQRRRFRRRQQTLEDRLASQAKELAAANREITELALSDPLTGLQSTRYFETRIDQDISLVLRRFERADYDDTVKPSGLGFFLISLDEFREMNRIHGEEVGNLVLREVAQRLRATVRESDTLVRWSGDEFLLVSQEASHHTAAALALRLHHVLMERPILVGDVPLALRCSLGFALFPFLWHHPGRLVWDQVIALAHGAVLRRKQLGPGAFIGFVGTADDLDAHQIVQMIEDPAFAESQGWLQSIAEVGASPSSGQAD